MLSQKLKELRLNKGLTQIEFAKTFNIANGTVGNWETGKRQPDYETLSRIADFYDVTVDYLLGRNDTTPVANITAETIGEIQAAYDHAPEEIKAAVRKLLDV